MYDSDDESDDDDDNARRRQGMYKRPKIDRGDISSLGWCSSVCILRGADDLDFQRIMTRL